MTSQEKTLARILFQSKIRSSDGNAFEELFSQIMCYSDAEFKQIKPWGNIGDRKNDGFIQSKGIYFQVYAPEEIIDKYPDAIKKLKVDFKGLLSQWNPVNEFYFVINDKYKGVNADVIQTMSSIVKDNNLNNGDILTASNLEKKLFELTDDQIASITGFIPDTRFITNIDYSVLAQTVGHIMKLPVIKKVGIIKYPDWDNKISFNKLSNEIKSLLENASFNIGSLNIFLANDTFLAEELQNQIIGIYEEHKKNFQGDDLFNEIMHSCMPRNEQIFMYPVITIMSKYFESCDIFEEPI